MIIGVIVTLAMLGATEPAITLARQDRQDTIYVIRGQKSALEAFHRNVGATWRGGTAIDDDPSDGTLRYWAFSDRTAAQSRALMMPAIFAGLQMQIEPYDESRQFPVKRRKLDQVAVRCGVKTDPFFITPERSVELSLPKNADGKLQSCLTDGVRLTVQLPISSARTGQPKGSL